MNCSWTLPSGVSCVDIYYFFRLSNHLDRRCCLNRWVWCIFSRNEAAFEIIKPTNN
jgi:hypothetical protein